MKVTNKLNLPEPVVEAVKYDDYDAGESDISVTSLIGSSMIRHLKEQHKDEIVVDAADCIYRLTGTAMHEILRRSNINGIAEKRLYIDCDGVKIGGQFDHQALDGDNVLSDYKETSVWTVIYGNADWEKQLNIYSLMLAENGYKEPDRLQVVAFLRDHQKSKAKHDPNYPQFRVHTIAIPKWTKEKTWEYIKQRVNHHVNNPPTCTDEERWKKNDTFAVMKKGRKTALRVLDSMEDARQWMRQNKDKGGTHVDTRQGKYGRCEDYCDCSAFCPIWSNQ